MKLFKERMKQGKPLIGTVLSMGLPIVAEMLSRCGFDWLWIDMEHAPLTLAEVQGFLQAKTKECEAFVRVPGNDEVWIKRVLDLGADGIIVPQVKTAEEAAKAVAACKYPPLGFRGIGLSRAQAFGMDSGEYVRNANDDIVVLLQIEHIDAVQNIESILQVPGIDAIIIGPYDMSGSYGKLGKIQDAEVQAAMASVQAACKKQSVPIGIFALLPEHARGYLKSGYQLVSVGVDSHFLWSSAKAALKETLL